MTLEEEELIVSAVIGCVHPVRGDVGASGLSGDCQGGGERVMPGS